MTLRYGIRHSDMKAPNRVNDSLLVAEHIQSEDVLHGITSDLRLNDWWGYLLVAQETIKTVLCQEESALVEVTISLAFRGTSDFSIRAFVLHSRSAKSMQEYQT